MEREYCALALSNAQVAVTVSMALTGFAICGSGIGTSDKHGSTETIVGTTLTLVLHLLMSSPAPTTCGCYGDLLGWISPGIDQANGGCQPERERQDCGEEFRRGFMPCDRASPSGIPLRLGAPAAPAAGDGAKGRTDLHIEAERYQSLSPSSAQFHLWLPEDEGPLLHSPLVENKKVLG
jgi:hypothetical protein